MARVFITGSSTGLGLMAAERLAGQGHEVTVHARSPERAGELRAVLPQAPVVLGDLSRMADVRRVAEQVDRIGRHDAVIHNAAVYRLPQRVRTDDGLCLTFAVNVLAPYLLTALLPATDRLVWMTSGLHDSGESDLDDAQWTRRRWDWMQAYADSKLHVTTLALGVARRRPQARSNAVSPGWVATRMGGPGAPDDLELGAETQVWLAAGEDDATTVTGRYLHHRQVYDVPAAARDPRRQEALLEYCAQLSGAPLA